MDVSLSSFQKWHQAVAQAVANLNTNQFPVALISALETLVQGEAAMISLEYKNRSPVLLFDHGIPLEKRDLLVSRYFSRGYMLDPFCLAVSGGLQQGFYHLAEIAPDDFFNSDYYKTYYIKAGSVEDCYFVVDLGENRKITVCLYHGDPAYRYSQTEFSQLRAVEPLVRELVLRHWGDTSFEETDQQSGAQSLARPLDAAFMNFGRSILTERELETTHLILRGHSSKSAARELDISPDTVREHRKNLYRKLCVSSQSELFSLFIDAISQFSEGSSEDPMENLLNSKT
ncbi:helix-turn-helix transcriptional regulator [Amphritea sp. 1_MG-2023]|uniref:response regulator transcription factor n=1 Tax=Amphritea sp. 1_MG-2023 TaxID=3062670 RepID=UPI0026E3C230|nr:helix-turn-helix transcriptional regulator [Amphritea sp. 1_MG-2023]MDO6563394.1 helix-turn-helix transcriptional regulator [Amphritea sp. 1_MG-2023]